VAAAFDLLDHSESVMVVDDDDLLSNRLVDFVSSEKFDGIWTIDRGYGWQTGSGSAYLINQFHRICGSSLILPAFRYKYSNKEYLDIAEAYRELGSHRIIVNENAHGGLPIRRVPFRASIYRRGHINSEETKNLVTQAKRLQVSDYLAPAMRLKNRLLSRLKERFSKKPSIIFEHRVMEWRRVSISRLQDEFFG